MIKFILKGHNLPHEVQTIVQVFYPNRHYYETDEISKETYTVVSILENGISGAKLYDCGDLVGEYKENYDEEEILNIKEKKRKIKTAIYKLLTKITGYTPVWGILTGIRPAKTVNDLIDEGMTGDEALRFLCDKYFVFEEKARLSLEVALEERKILEADSDKDVSVYIGIPFCPTRCLYCSFTSYMLSQYKNKVDAYIDSLIKEIEFTSQYTSKYNVKNIYIGGGTPTSLNEEQLERLLTAVDENFDVKNTVEYTVEAGRPDTITEEKLVIMKKHNVSRISINPQTMNQKTLDIIGRNHSVSDIKNIFEIARKVGHNNINMDIILGLPEENATDVSRTMEEIMKLSPENVTVHTLAVKRASRLKEQFDLYTLTSLEEMEKMLSVSQNYAEKMGLKPYYMYRQKNMLGSFENVGYCKEGTEGIYNVEIMEEHQTIFACGAGATTKTVDRKTGRIERIFNVKSVDDYISRLDEMLERKKEGLKNF